MTTIPENTHSTSGGDASGGSGPGHISVIGRIPILDLSPQLPDNLWPAKAFVGEVVPFSATAFREGHDLIGVTLLITDSSGVEAEHAMTLVDPGLDRWQTLMQLSSPGTWSWRVRAWADEYGTWLHNASIKIPADLDVDLMFALGDGLLERAASDSGRDADDVSLLSDARTHLSDARLSTHARLAAASAAPVKRALTSRPVTNLVTESESRQLRVERRRAGVGAWYEFFPRSVGAKQRPDGSWISGTFRTAARRLPAIAAMGFDVVYLPPIHPIGEAFRKGPNNSLTVGQHDPGSPWAIGSAAGGHDAIHPDLGTETDFSYFLSRAKANKLEVAIDLALQAAPDHPWVTEHPEWFTTLPDGSIAYAENPPKKYQDIYPINFNNDPAGLYAEVLRIVRHWIGLGVRIFRVDNPHTKPLDFWEWLLHEVNSEYPDVVFLAEAFTRPALLTALAKVGFQQSYTYFTWRNTKAELEEFLDDLAHDTADYLRPNLFVNTPDILTEYLQFGGPAAFKIRAAIAATSAPVWGVYSGFELFENVARPGAEENIDNEKYEFRPRDYKKAEQLGVSLAPYLAMLNTIRREHPALTQLRNLDIHSSDDESILVFSKYLDAAFTGTGQADAIIVVANVDPHSVRETMTHLDVTRFGVPEGADYVVTDLVTGSVWTWSADNYVRLDAFTEPVHILNVKVVTQ